jgi:hypothetical protein
MKLAVPIKSSPTQWMGKKIKNENNIAKDNIMWQHLQAKSQKNTKNKNTKEALCHGVIFRYANKPVRQPSASLDSDFPRQSHSCLLSN